MAVLTKMKILISLAQSDGKVADRERSYIINIGQANGLTPEQINPLIDSNHDFKMPEDLPEDEKFNYIFSLVELMKIDERMYKEEMTFCSKIATHLGYQQEVMFDLLLHVKAGRMSPAEKDELKNLTRKYLLPK